MRAQRAKARRFAPYHAALGLLCVAGCNELLGLDPGIVRTNGGDAGEATGGALGESGAPGNGKAGFGGSRGGSTSGAGGSAADDGTGGSAGEGAGGSAGEGASGTGGSGPDAGASAGSGGSSRGVCSTNTECREQDFDWPHICRAGRCIDITNDYCDIVIGHEYLEPEPEPFIIGVIWLRQRPQSESIGRERRYWALRLALDEFRDSAASRGGIPINGVTRQPLMLVCSYPRDDLFDSYDIEHQLVDHLVETVGTPGILLLTDEVHYTASYALDEKNYDVLFLHPGGLTPEVAALDDDGRIWHMLGQDLDLAPIYVPLVERIEEHVNPAATRTRPTRLVMIVPSIGGFYGAQLPAPLSSTLRLNGRPVSEQLDENFFVIRQEPFVDVGARTAERAPDIVVNLVSSSFHPHIEAAVRERNAPLPFYVGPPFETGQRVMIPAMEKDPSLRKRFVGVGPAAAEETGMYRDYLARARSVAPADVDMRELENFYDLPYFLLYAAAAAGRSGEVNGHTLRDGMLRLIGGARHDIGPLEIPTILDILGNTDEKIGFYATMGAPNFDLDSGARIVPGSVWCVTEKYGLAYHQLRHDPATGELRGTFSCFDF